MAHAAEIAPDGTVLKVIVIPDDVTAEEFDAFCAPHGAKDSTWRRTYTDRSARKNYAGPGYTFDAGRDAFIPPKPVDEKGAVFNSWVLDEATANWKPPKPVPSDGKDYAWDEPTGNWKIVAAVADGTGGGKRRL